MIVEFFPKEGLEGHNHPNCAASSPHPPPPAEPHTLKKIIWKHSCLWISASSAMSHEDIMLLCFLSVHLQQDRGLQWLLTSGGPSASGAQRVLSKWQGSDLHSHKEQGVETGFQPSPRVRVHAFPAQPQAAPSPKTEHGERAQDPKASQFRDRSRMLTRKREHWQSIILQRKALPHPPT